MKSEFLFTALERKLLLSILSFSFCVFCLNIGHKITESYNEEIKFEQIQKRDLAKTTNLQIRFNVSDSSSPAVIYQLIYWSQLFLLPLSYYFLRKQKIGGFIFSTFFHFAGLFSVSCWAYSTYTLYSFNELVHQRNNSFGDYLLHGSNPLDFLFLGLIATLFIMQISILLRFAVGKFQAKISLK